MREKLAWSTKSQAVTNSRKRSQMIASSSKWFQAITNQTGNDRKCSELVVNVRKRLQMITNGRKCSKCSKFPNVLSISNVSNVSYVSNAPNVLNVSNVPEVPDVPNVLNVLNGPYVAKSRKNWCPNFTVTWKITLVYSWEIPFLTISGK